MIKTYEEYLNDPEIINEPMGLRIAHAVRFKIQDETKGMTRNELHNYYHEGEKEALKKLGITPKYTTPYK
ncbi:MAG: hypothetical protein LBI04_02240 [Treponema sp.]|jgi:hypothetical protein|nr:hypothetical protein [Treponema sp.]